jgi:hypothetical protein
MAGQSTHRRSTKGNGQLKKQAWNPSIPFFKEEKAGTTEEEDRSSGLEKRRSCKLKLRPSRDDDDDNHYTLYIRQFEYNSTSTDPEAWCFWRSALEGLRETI